MKTDHILQGGLHLRRKGLSPVPGGLHPPTARRIQRRPRHRIHAAVGRLIARLDGWWVARTLRHRDIRLANGQRLTYVPTPNRRTRR